MPSKVHIWILALVALLLGCNDVQRDVFAGKLKRYRFPTASMEPTIPLGEYAYARPVAESENIRRGELIVFRYPYEPKTMLCKRVIAIPGDTVEIRHKRVWLNGEPLHEGYAAHADPNDYNAPNLPEPFKSRDNFGPITIGADQYFVLGDNRERSNDSRYWGTVPRSSITGELVLTGPMVGPFRKLE